MSDETQEEQEARLAELEAKAAKADELEAQLKAKEEELAKEREKDKNFSKAREIEKNKRSKLGMEVDELKAQVAKEREERQSLHGVILNKAKETALSQLAGSDKELRTQLEERVKESEAYYGAPKSDEEIIGRYEKAYEFLKNTQRKVNPIHAFSPVTGQMPGEPRTKRFSETAEGEALIRAKFPKIAEIMDKRKGK